MGTVCAWRRVYNPCGRPYHRTPTRESTTPATDAPRTWKLASPRESGCPPNLPDAQHPRGTGLNPAASRPNRQACAHTSPAPSSMPQPAELDGIMTSMPVHRIPLPQAQEFLAERIEVGHELDSRLLPRFNLIFL